MRGKLYTSGLNTSMKTHYVYLQYAWQLPPPPYGPNRPRRMLRPATKRATKATLLWPLGCALPTPIAPSDLPAYFCQGRHWGTCNASRDTDVPVLGRLAQSPGPLLHPQACASSGSGCRICTGWLRAAADGNAGAMARRCWVCRSWGRGTPPARLGRPRGPRGFRSFSYPGAGCGGYTAGCAVDWPWAPQWKKPI